uniref:Uncharacterized protein n=1 Tax=Helianthus annuus TaxID=4232 RepID=A0A251VS92_HELAN
MCYLDFLLNGKLINIGRLHTFLLVGFTEYDDDDDDDDDDTRLLQQEVVYGLMDDIGPYWITMDTSMS